jgi:hypothetical protein
VTWAVLAAVALMPGCDRPTPVAPEGTTLSISANPTRIELNATSSITVIARRSDGTPVNDGTVINLSTTLGSIDATAETDDAGVAVAILQGGDRVGTATVRASSGASTEVSTDVEVGSVAGVLSLEANPNSISQDAASTDISLVAVVQDEFGSLLPSVPVTFSTEIGSLASGGAAVFTDTAGQALDTLTVRREELSGLTEPFFTVTVRATGEGGTVIEESVDIDVLGGPASMFFQATPTSVSSEVGGVVDLLAGVRDGSGDPLAGVNVNFLTEIGSLASGGVPIETGPDGLASDVLTVTPADLAGFVGSTFTVRAQAAGFGGLVLEQTATIRIQTGFPIASFSFSIDEPTNTVDFFDNSTGQAPLSCEWDFGAGANPGTSSSCGDHEVTYVTTGTKTVSLTVSNVLGTDTASATFEILP